jgi:hypothetical protein
LALFKQVVRSPLTPDTLEGIWRCGVVFEVPVTLPADVVAAFVRQRRTVCVEGKRMPAILEFWRSKSDIYQRFINREDVITWESAWALALEQCCTGMSLAKDTALNNFPISHACGIAR